jgi:hypothetical protein
LPLIVVGEAVKDTITGGLDAATPTTAEAVTEPAALEAVRVYVVFSDGDTAIDPLGLTSPTL